MHACIAWTPVPAARITAFFNQRTMPAQPRHAPPLALAARLARHEEPLTRVAALVCSMLMLVLMARVLLDVPSAGPRQEAHASAGIQVTLLARLLDAPQLPPRQSSRPMPVDRRAQNAASAQSPPAAAAPTPTRRAASNAAGAVPQEPARLYGRDGSVRIGEVVDPLDDGAAVPPGMEDPRTQARARRVLERPDPVQYRETRFNRDWKSDGTLGDVAVQGLERGMKGLKNAIFGGDTQMAVARPPPDVRFNPALAENTADLGSEATGDAYKAAPIAHETPPAPTGEATRRIRAQLAALEQRPSMCGATQRQALLAPARAHLGDLERAESALVKGADPVMARQMLPRQIDSAYDLARRALWYAERGLGACSGAG